MASRVNQRRNSERTGKWLVEIGHRSSVFRPDCNALHLASSIYLFILREQRENVLGKVLVPLRQFLLNHALWYLFYDLCKLSFADLSIYRGR
jgi:hypothetical protein